MAQKYYFGTIGSTGVSTGPHGHFYVKDLRTNNYIDPGTIKSQLAGFRVGPNEIPLITKNKQGQLDINPETGLTLTSKFGPRSRPTAGASSDHKGWDLAGPEGTQLKFVSAGGTYVPKTNQGGYGNLGTFITPDQRYEIGVGHLKDLGKQTAGTRPSTPSSTSESFSPDDAAAKVLQALFGGKQEEPKPAETLANQMVGQLLGQVMQRKQQKSFDPYEGYTIDPGVLNQFM
jgi:hypothetical protein